eukprot:363877-Chlamydomonas_euryale.AAC.5
MHIQTSNPAIVEWAGRFNGPACSKIWPASVAVGSSLPHTNRSCAPPPGACAATTPPPRSPTSTPRHPHQPAAPSAVLLDATAWLRTPAAKPTTPPQSPARSTHSSTAPTLALHLSHRDTLVAGMGARAGSAACRTCTAGCVTWRTPARISTRSTCCPGCRNRARCWR